MKNNSFIFTPGGPEKRKLAEIKRIAFREQYERKERLVRRDLKKAAYIKKIETDVQEIMNGLFFAVDNDISVTYVNRFYSESQTY